MNLDHYVHHGYFKMSPRYLNGHTQWVTHKEEVIWYEITTNTWNIGNVDCHTVDGILRPFANNTYFKSTSKYYFEIPDFFNPRFPWKELKGKKKIKGSKTRLNFWEGVTLSFEKIGPGIQIIHLEKELAKEVEFVILGLQESCLI